jgi:hypothetical protein
MSRKLESMQILGGANWMALMGYSSSIGTADFQIQRDAAHVGSPHACRF